MKLQSFLLIALSIVVLSSCSKKSTKDTSSSTTGWKYNDPQMGGFQSDGEYDQATGPGLVFIQGGTFTMGKVEEDVMHTGDNPPRRVTVASFYMDETEVRNIDYREYLYWLRKVYPSNPEKYQAALPDTLVWREELAYNEPYINNYLRHPAYSKYPVVGVNWIQANDYCKWRTDRVNEKILIDRGIIAPNPDQKAPNIFTTEAYLAGLYNGTAGKTPLHDAKNSERRARWEDGFLLPTYRLPTEAEWEYAAYGMISSADGNLQASRKIYPWKGSSLRSPERKTQGQMRANFTRGRGDLMGVAGALNDNADIPAPVDSYEPNDYGLYCMAGNVNEWVADVYRPLSNLDVNEFQPFRGNVFTRYKKDAQGKFVRDKYGNFVTDTIADYRNYKDGSYESQIVAGDNWIDHKNLKTKNMYIQGKKPGEFSSLITDHVRVYKGGSWKDRPYWLSPGTRRYLDENRSANDLGFRCAMTRVGSPKGFKKR